MQPLKIVIAATAVAFVGLSLNLAKHYKGYAEIPESVHTIAESKAASRMHRILRDLDRHSADRPRIRRETVDDDLVFESLSEIYRTLPEEPVLKHTNKDVDDAE